MFGLFSPLISFCVCRSPWQKRVDAYCGVVVLALYFTYFLVVKGMLSAYDCTKNASGIPILNADPAFRCDEVKDHFASFYHDGCFLHDIAFASIRG